LAPEEVVLIQSLPDEDRPEGVAVAHSGTVFLGNRRISEGLMISEILDVSTPGVPSVFATLETSGDPDLPGLLGLATDPPGDVYAAIVSLDPEVHGVWHIDGDGTRKERLPGSEQMAFPNALTFDALGNLYVTDSAAGSVWRFGRHAPGALWVHDPLLAPGSPSLPILPPVGANGIVFLPPNLLFVANTRQGSIIRIPIAPDGSAGTPAVAAQDPALLTVDGLAADTFGNIHAVIPGFALLQSHPLVQVDPGTGQVVQTPTEDAAFHFPLSLAFATGPWDPRTVFVVNGGEIVPGFPGAGPGLVQAKVSAPGR
jgi:hypothetical protein